MKCFIGTSGWSYKSWNPDGLPWYVLNSGLNAIELNMSFYRYPKVKDIEKWQNISPHLTWVIKVNQAITHIHRFREPSLSLFKSFLEIFKPMGKRVAFYLFQLPSSIRQESIHLIEDFFFACGLGSRFALEWRHPSWWTDTNIAWAAGLGLTLVSVDAPDLPRQILKTSDSVYLRLHGRRHWYEHDYSYQELSAIAESISANHPKKAFVFFNNDEATLKNAQRMVIYLGKTDRE